MDNEELVENFALERNIKTISKYSYKDTIKIYTKFHNMSMYELIKEAEEEEEAGIRWKKRRLKKRLIDYRNHLNKKYLHSTAKNHFSRIITVYKHYEIEVHDLPVLSKKNVILPDPINFKDLPDKEIIKQSLKITIPIMRAIILFMSSSGCARRETLNLTVGDFIDATKEYHGKDNIYEAISIMKSKEDIIPIFHIKRQKTNKYYYAICSPEATTEIINYLISRKKKLANNDKLFKINLRYLGDRFQQINDTLNLGKKGTYNRFRSHMLRKFHASQLYNDGVPLEIVDSLQGRGKDSTHSSYFMDDPEKLKDIYIKHMNSVTINLDVNNLDIKSTEYIKLENKYKAKSEELDETKKNYGERISAIEKYLETGEKGDLKGEDVIFFS